jgi:tetratricopeptide (TPR) repeat protein
MAKSQGSGRKATPAPVKIHRFEKRAPGTAPGREREELAGAAPTVPELALKPPRKGGAAAEPAPAKAQDPSSAKTELELPAAQPEPAPPERGSGKSKRKKSRTYQGPSPSPRTPPVPEAEPAPGSVAERLATSRRLFSEGKLEEARSTLERLVALGVATGPVHTQLGAIYLAQGAVERALERFEEALSRDPEDLSATLYRGEARLARGDLLLATADLRHVLDLGMAGSPLVQRAQQLLQQAADRKRR